jgi:voltage-gated potassium channel
MRKSGDDVIVYKENRTMERKLERLTNHVVVVVAYPSLGQRVATKLERDGETVLILDSS